MSTEMMSSRFADLDLWPSRDAVLAMMEGQLAAAAAVQSQATAIAAAADQAAARLKAGAGRLVYIGAGTSGRIAVQDGVELVPTYDWPEERLLYALAGGTEALLTSVEGAEDDASAGEELMRSAALGPEDVAIGVAASGRTPYTVAALRTAGGQGALTIAISSNASTPLLEAASHPILLDTGAEIVAGSTRMKAGTAQKIALNLLSTTIMLRLGRIYKGLMVNMRVSNRKLQARAAFMVAEMSGVSLGAAEEAMADAGGDIKLAALLAIGYEAGAAREALAETTGNLRSAIERLGRN